MSGLGDHSPRAMREPRTSHRDAVRYAALDIRTEEMMTPERMAMTC